MAASCYCFWGGEGTGGRGGRGNGGRGTGDGGRGTGTAVGAIGNQNNL